MAKEIASQLNLKDKEQKKKKKEKSVEEKEEKRRKKEAQLGAVVPFWALREFDEASFAAAERFLQTCFAWLTENKCTYCNKSFYISRRFEYRIVFVLPSSTPFRRARPPRALCYCEVGFISESLFCNICSFLELFCVDHVG